VIERLAVRDVKIGQVGSAIDVDMLYEEGAKGGFRPVVRELLFERICVEHARHALFLRGLPGSPIEQVSVRDSVFRGVEKGTRLEGVGTLELRNVVIEPDR
jgi:unsaturated rhamnogalacturonyl hydrolase